jgi:hypothetical protein
MSDDSRNEIKVRVIRDGVEPPDNDWSKATPEERIEAVWTLTKIRYGWNKYSDDDVPKFHRTVTRVIRKKS